LPEKAPENSNPSLAIAAQGLTKTYGAVTAVERLDLAIAEGQFFGLLGPNGSGKTTTLHMLSTLARPSAGWATVAGYDVLREPVAVRRNIGLVFQESALDRTLTVEENLRLAGALYKLPARMVRERSGELLDLFGLSDKHRIPVGQLSGGMRRALDIARGILHHPRILFLDEPTIGLDVLNRRAIWRFIERLRQEQRVTVLLTTHYLEEATECDEVAFLNQGKIIGHGAPDALIQALGAYVLEIEDGDLKALAAQFTPLLGKPLTEVGKLIFRIPDEDFPFAQLQRELRAKVCALQLRRPDLNDVYVWLNSPGAQHAAATAFAETEL
jgi:ABC-type multidrug transport system, ATPase component